MEISEAAELATRSLAAQFRTGGPGRFGTLITSSAEDLGSWSARELNRSQDGHDALWYFAQMPDGPGHAAAVAALLANRASSETAFATELIRRAAPRPVPAPNQRTNVSNGGVGLNVGGSMDAAGAHIVGGDYSSVSTTNNKKEVHRGGARYLLVAIVAIVVIVALVKGVIVLTSTSKDGGINANSTCQQFLDADQGTEQQAIVDVALAQGEGGFGSPLALPEIRYECSGTPGMTIGAVIQRDKGEY